WLDPSMTYSCARFEPEHLSLEAAQNAKYASLAKRIALQPGQHMLEIGCGWGGFSEFAARDIGSNVTAITISEQQHAFAAERIQAAGLNDKVEIKLQDYRDVDACYDRIVSIEMFEAVGERNWPIYFDKLASSLKPGGVAGLQIITIADRYFESYRKGVDFIQRHVFPGGMLPSPQSLCREMDKAGLQQLGELSFGRDYAMTLAVWYERFQKAWPTIAALGFDQRFKRLWQYYLAYCEAGFRVGATNVHQIAVKPA
ncbi:MAG: cyclopropane-fatty-acyl-phospholipid synthase family protein, partial [Alphaproteobacteria bacterium]|nr:cyclopropane-fatty-acyl-phospholipid synthase family protein [Alphaproteobacteria bacterium]